MTRASEQRRGLHRGQYLGRACLLLTLLVCSACSLVTVHSSRGVETRLYPGLTILKAEPDALTFYKQAGIGFFADGTSIRGGIFKELRAYAQGAQQCQVLIMVGSDAQLDALRCDLRSRPRLWEQICVVSEQGELSHGEDIQDLSDCGDD